MARTAIFNHFAFALSCAVLIGMTTVHLDEMSRSEDIGQFYMGGLMARTGNWSDLYPEPYAKSLQNPGARADSAMKPLYARLASESGVGDTYRFIQPPPAALMLSPLSFVPFKLAAKLWILTMAGCGILVVWQTGWITELVWQKPTYFRGISILAVGCCPNMLHSITCGNMAPFIGLSIGTAVIGLVRRQDTMAGLGIALGAIFKYTTFPLVIIPLFTMRLRVLARTFVILIGLSGVTLCAGGITPFREFVRLAPYLARPYLSKASPNNTIYKVLWKLRGSEPLSKSAFIAIGCLRWSLLAFLVVLGFRWREELLRRKELCVAMSACLITWFLMFSPVVWGTYVIYIAPFAGWILWEIYVSRWMAVLLAGPMLLLMLPWVPLLSPWREPLQSSLFWALGAIFCAGALRLLRSPAQSTPAERCA